MKNKLTVYLGLIYLLFCPAFVFGEDGNVSAVLSQEIANGKTIDIFPFLPAIKLPAGITIHFFMLILSAVLIIALFFYAKRNAVLKPRGLLVALEGVIFFVRDDIVFPVMGEEKGEKWLPFFAHYFYF